MSAEEENASKMEAPVYFDEDADLNYMDGVVAIIGYGNQGRAQALNLKESGVDVIVGTIRDESWNDAEADGFNVMEIQSAAEKARIILLLIPDEVQPHVFSESISPSLAPDKVLCFASGYNITFGMIKPPDDVDTVLVAPRMIGVGVRQAYMEGRGFYAFIAVHNDQSGKAKQVALAIAKGIGATKPGGGVLEVTFRQEAELDLFNEQCFGPAFGQVLTSAVDVAIEAGYPPEAVLVEIYMSGELAYTMQKIAEMGTLKQLDLHSPTSQYGSMSRGIRYVNPELREQMRTSLSEIQDGSFAKEFTEEYGRNLETLKDMKEMAQDLPIVYLDEAVRKRLHSKTQ
ncbi:MAG: ketol-acid reductoisomerase [Candidatus Thorarchaeota archaeon]|jgi:ketol-acid reductoisomerase